MVKVARRTIINDILTRSTGSDNGWGWEKEDTEAER